jgi:hypothetical protein
MLCVLAFAQNAWTECAGWQSTAQARKACCGACHNDNQQSERHEYGVTQAQADACCAASEPDQSETAAMGGASVVLAAGPQLAVPAAAVTMIGRIHRFAHIRTSPVPKHLLLSVLLV